MRTPEELQKIFEGPTGRRLCLLFVGLLSFSMSTLWAPPSSYTQIPLQGDHAKFFWFTLKQTQWFLDHGSPFGVAAYIHNAMPGFFFLRTGFVFYLPFYLFFGPALGYALLTVSATVLFAIGTFLLVEALATVGGVHFCPHDGLGPGPHRLPRRGHGSLRARALP